MDASTIYLMIGGALLGLFSPTEDSIIKGLLKLFCLVGGVALVSLGIQGG